MDIIKQRLSESIGVKEQILNNTDLLQTVKKAAYTIIDRIKAGNTIYFCGNGGSAADAQHISAELSGRFCFDRAPLPSEALHCNSSFITAVANDYSFDVVYARLLQGIGHEGDVLVGISTSGNSINIVNALKTAKRKKIFTIALTGSKGGAISEIVDLCIKVPSESTARIQESQITLGHIICEIVENELFENPNNK